MLIDLALGDRIDTDLEHLFVIDEAPNGDTSLDLTHSILTDVIDEGRKSAKN